MVVVAVILAASLVGALDAVKDSDEQGAEWGKRAKDEHKPAFGVGPDDEVADDVYRVERLVG